MRQNAVAYSKLADLTAAELIPLSQVPLSIISYATVAFPF